MILVRALLLALAFQVAAWGAPVEWEPPPSVVSLLTHKSVRTLLLQQTPYALSALLQTQRASYAQVQVTSGFSDARGVSRYRSQAGLHLGYDLAMPYGCAVLCAWPGRVEAVIPWYGSEVGVRVRHSDGTCATYGHVQARVKAGELVEPGQILGTIASDHLDVKMRDASDQPLDFGLETLAGQGSNLRIQWLRASLEWWSARDRLTTAESDVARLCRLSKAPRPSLEAIPVYLREGILSPRQAERARQAHRLHREQKARLQEGRLQLERLRQQEQSLARACSKFYAQARQAGDSWLDAERYMRSKSRKDEV